MKWLFHVILLLNIPSLLFADDFDLRKLYSFQWSSVELPSTKEEKRAVIDFIYRKDSLLVCQDWDSTSFENFSSYLHLVHINSDHLLDAIYSGEYCGEGMLTYVMINNGNTYEIVYYSLGEIKYLNLRDRIVNEFYLEEVGCCDDIRANVHNCHAYDSANNIRFDCKLGADYSWVELPHGLYPNPKLGNVSAKKLTLRMSPKIENSPYDENFEIHGNIIGSLLQKEKITVWTEDKDTKGRKWYFIQAKGTIGWVMAKYIKILKDVE